MNLPILKTVASLALWGLMPFGLNERADAASYATGFEQPQFAAGPFPSQDAYWNLFAASNGADLTNEVRIETAFVRSGAQALQINASSANSVQSGVSGWLENSAAFVTIQADVLLRASTAQTVWQFAAGDSGASGGFVGGFNIFPDDGRFQLITGGFPQTGPVIARDVWSHYELDFNLLTQTYTVVVNGSIVAPNVPFLASTSQLRIFQFDTFAGGNDSAVVDNYSFAATPEPSTFMLLAGGAMVLSSYRGRDSTSFSGRSKARRDSR